MPASSSPKSFTAQNNNVEEDNSFSSNSPYIRRPSSSIQQPSITEPEGDGDLSYKILVVGESKAGKTAFIHRYVKGEFLGNYRNTIGVDFAAKSLVIAKKDVSLQLWDISGQERFRHLSRVYYKGASGAFVAFDVSEYDTFTTIGEWKKSIDVVLPGIPVILLACKCDLKEAVDSQAMEDACEKYGFVGYCQTSSKEGLNISESVLQLADKVIKNENERRKIEQTVALAQIEEERQQQQRKMYCC